MSFNFCLSTGLLCILFCMGARADTCGTIVGNLVDNCGFETGTFSQWSLSGTNSSPIFNGVAYGVDTADAHSGGYGGYLGGFGGVLNISQTIATNPGSTYSVTYWLAQSPATVAPYQTLFTAGFGNTTFASLSQVGNLPYLQYTQTVVATSPSTMLAFGFRDDTGFFSIDDISVTPTISTAPEPGSFFLFDMGAIGSALLWRARKSFKL